jgi:hypothetical protein
MVEKEVMMHAVSYNLVRSLMQLAAVRHQVDLTRISFKGTDDTLRHWSASLEAMRGMPRKQKSLLSPITSKCTTCDHFKVHHFGRVFF